MLSTSSACSLRSITFRSTWPVVCAVWTGCRVGSRVNTWKCGQSSESEVFPLKSSLRMKRETKGKNISTLPPCPFDMLSVFHSIRVHIHSADRFNHDHLGTWISASKTRKFFTRFVKSKGNASEISFTNWEWHACVWIFTSIRRKGSKSQSNTEQQQQQQRKAKSTQEDDDEEVLND